MNKTVGSHDEDKAAWPLDPSRLDDVASKIISGRRCSLDREGAKAMFAGDPTRRAIERGPVERSHKCELVSSPKWSIGLVIGAYVIAIPPGRRAVACVEFRTHFGG